MRADFLGMDVVCILLAAGAAVWTHGRISLLYLLLAFVGATSAHIAVNALNEWGDFHSGLDLRDERTPFSGGSGTLMTRPDLAPFALGIALLSLGVTALIGVFFLIVRGWPILPLGLLGLVVIVVYTQWITRYPLLSVLVTGLGFGLLMVTGTYFVLTGTVTWTTLCIALVPFFLGNALWLLNQFPDVEADRRVGRRNLIMITSRQTSAFVFGYLLLATYASILAGVWLGHLPLSALLGLLTLPLAAVTAVGVVRHSEDLPGLVRYMGYNVIINLATTALPGIGLLLAAWAG